MLDDTHGLCILLCTCLLQAFFFTLYCSSLRMATLLSLSVQARVTKRSRHQHAAPKPTSDSIYARHSKRVSFFSLPRERETKPPQATFLTVFHQSHQQIQLQADKGWGFFLSLAPVSTFCPSPGGQRGVVWAHHWETRRLRKPGATAPICSHRKIRFHWLATLLLALVLCWRTCIHRVKQPPRPDSPRKSATL